MDTWRLGSGRAVALVAVLGLLVCGTAAAVPCGIGGVSPNAGCRDGSGANDSADKLNDGAYFGIDTWALLNRAESDDGAPATGVDETLWTGDFAGENGYFDLNPMIWAWYEALNVVLKDGVTEEVQWSAYRLPEGHLDYTWSYNGGGKEISHISLYGAGNGVPVPAPTPLALVGLGLVGLLLVRRRLLG